MNSRTYSSSQDDDSREPIAETQGNSSSEPVSSAEPSAKLIATAYHEAGHAVMALIVGRAVQKVTIDPRNLQTGGVRLGACQLKKGRVKRAGDELEDEVLILLAGMISESHFTGEYCRRGASQDIIAARRLMASRVRSEKQLERLERRMIDKTEYLLDDPETMRAIQGIAAELLQRLSISGRAAQHLFDQATKGS